jgi:hypothetical protein
MAQAGELKCGAEPIAEEFGTNHQTDEEVNADISKFKDFDARTKSYQDCLKLNVKKLTEDGASESDIAAAQAKLDANVESYSAVYEELISLVNVYKASKAD